MVEAQRILHSAWVYRLELKKSIGQHGGSAMCRKPREKTRERIREKTQRENPKGKPTLCEDAGKGCVGGAGLEPYSG